MEHLIFPRVKNGIVSQASKKTSHSGPPCWISLSSLAFSFFRMYNPGQNVLGHLRKLGTKRHFAKLTHILPLKKAWVCCYKGLFLLSPSPPSSVDCVELKLEYITSTLHRGGRGERRCLNLTSSCVSVPTVLNRVVVLFVPLGSISKILIRCFGVSTGACIILNIVCF